MTNKSSFSSWADDRNNEDSDDKSDSYTLLGFGMQLRGIQDNFANQMLELSGTLPDGPLNEAFRNRLSASVYLLLASIGFGSLAIFVGLPTLILKPAKFIMLMTLSSLLGAASVIVMKKPLVFIHELYEAGIAKSAPIVCLLLSMILTIYVTLVIHRYFYVIAVGALQVACLLWLMSDFIPGGWSGIKVLLKAAYMMMQTSISPCIYFTKRQIRSIFS